MAGLQWLTKIADVGVRAISHGRGDIRGLKNALVADKFRDTSKVRKEDTVGGYKSNTKCSATRATSIPPRFRKNVSAVQQAYQANKQQPNADIERMRRAAAQATAAAKSKQKSCDLSTISRESFVMKEAKRVAQKLSTKTLMERKPYDNVKKPTKPIENTLAVPQTIGLTQKLQTLMNIEKKDEGAEIGDETDAISPPMPPKQPIQSQMKPQVKPLESGKKNSKKNVRVHENGVAPQDLSGHRGRAASATRLNNTDHEILQHSEGKYVQKNKQPIHSPQIKPQVQQLNKDKKSTKITPNPRKGGNGTPREDLKSSCDSAAGTTKFSDIESGAKLADRVLQVGSNQSKLKQTAVRETSINGPHTANPNGENLGSNQKNGNKSKTIPREAPLSATQMLAGKSTVDYFE